MYYHEPPEPCTLTSPIPLNSDSVNDHEHTMSKHNSGPRFLNKKALHYNYLTITSILIANRKNRLGGMF